MIIYLISSISSFTKVPLSRSNIDRVPDRVHYEDPKGNIDGFTSSKHTDQEMSQCYQRDHLPGSLTNKYTDCCDAYTWTHTHNDAIFNKRLQKERSETKRNWKNVQFFCVQHVQFQYSCSDMWLVMWQHMVHEVCGDVVWWKWLMSWTVGSKCQTNCLTVIASSILYIRLT